VLQIGEAKDLSAPLRGPVLKAQLNNAFRERAQGMTRPQRCFGQAVASSDLWPECTREEHREFRFEILYRAIGQVLRPAAKLNLVSVSERTLDDVQKHSR
jgi:hypothetical protein